MSNHASFLPEDYLNQKAEQRTNVISLVLFVVVMLGVFLAFLVTNRKWTEVKYEQSAINLRYQEAAEQINELLELEHQKSEMLQKAELAAALVERVPRSVLLADLINRMPERLSLLEFKLKSERLKPIVTRTKADKKGRKGKKDRLGAKRAQTKDEASEAAKVVRPPRYKVTVTLVGVAATVSEVTRYLAALNNYDLLDEVVLENSLEKEIEGLTMQKFTITLVIDSKADVRNVPPVISPRKMNDAITSGFRLAPPATAGVTANADRTVGGE